MSSVRSCSSNPTSTRGSSSGFTAGGGHGGGSSRFASVSNLAERDLLRGDAQLFGMGAARHGQGLPEELVTRSGWTLVTEPRLRELATGIIEDNYNKMEAFIPQLAELTERLSGFKIEITTRSGVRIACRNMFLGHLLCLCASPRVLQLLHNHHLLSARLFSKKIDILIDFDPKADASLPEDSVFAAEIRKFHWQSIPTFFMCILRDTFDSFEWLLKQQLLRKLTDTDAAGRNILHAAIEMESPLLMTRLLTKQQCCPLDQLQLLMKQKEKETNLTPLLKACAASNAAMLVLIMQNLPKPFLEGEMDASGVSQSIITAIIRNVKDSTISLELVTHLLSRGATPDTAFFDKRSCLDVLIAAEHFSGHDLCHLVNSLVKSNARVDLSVMIRCLSCTFRAESEIDEIALELTHAAGAAALTDPHQAELREMGEESLDMESNVVVQMLRNPQLSPNTVQHLLNHFSNFINISAIFPSVQQLAKALVQGICTELHIGESGIDEENSRAPLAPNNLHQVLQSLSVFTASAHRDSIRQQRYRDSLFHYMMSNLFRDCDFEQSLLPKEKLTRLLPEYLLAMEEAGLDMNATVDGRVSIFAAFEATCPGWLSLSLLRHLPKSFQLNIRDKKGSNLAVVLMKTFSTKYKMLLAGLKVLKSLNFSMNCEVLGKNTLLMAFVQICGTGFKSLEQEDSLDEEKASQFLEVFNFLLSEGSSICQNFTQKDVDDHLVTVSALSIAMSLGVSLLVLEILRRSPSSIFSVRPRTLLTSLNDFPELLEMLNSKTQCRDHMKTLAQSSSRANNLPQMEANGVETGGKTSEGCKSTIRQHWRVYVRKNHSELLKLANEEENFQQSVLLIYDYFQECQILAPADDEDDEEEEAAKSGQKQQPQQKQKQKVRKKVEVVSAEMDQEIFRSSRNKGDRMNSKLMLIIADNPVLKTHPMISQYLERYYVKAMVMALIMNLFHFFYVVLLTGHVSWVNMNSLAEPNHYSGFHLNRPADHHGVTGYFDCRYRSCVGGASFFAHRSRDCAPDPSNSSCTICRGRVLSESNCVEGDSSKTFSRCPIFDWDRGWFWITPAQYILIVLSLISFIKEVFQLITAPRAYAKHLAQNTIEMAMYIAILLTSINTSECPWSSGYRDDWQHEVSIIAVFLAWSMMFFYMSRFQAFSTYVMMFYTSVRTGLGLLVAFFCIIIGYVQVFHMLLKNQYAFRDMWVSFLKVIEMLVGGLDYNDIFNSVYDPDSGTISTSSQKIVYSEFFTRIVYFSFIIIMCVVLMNLFIGLIVGDVEKINQEAEVKTWTYCVGFIDIAHDMLQWSTPLYARLKRICSNGTDASHGGGHDDHDDHTEIRIVKMKSTLKSPTLAIPFGLVSGKVLGEQLLICEKRKVKVKVLTKFLHNKLPFLYTVYDPCTSAQCAEEINFKGSELNEEHRHSNMHSCNGHAKPDALRRLAVPEDVHFDDPFVRQKQNTVVFPNRLNRLKQQERLGSISESSDH